MVAEQLKRSAPAVRSFRRGSGESGQVLLLGVVMLTMLLLLILYSFDIHNLIRAKFKTETAQQAAALAGADWQKESLNLIGEINLIKVCETLMQDDDRWERPLPEVEKNDPESLRRYREVMRGRMALLSEMQSRISFIGPVIGFAAAQQAAKANGLSPIGSSGEDYLWLLENDFRYRELFGGAPEVINNYRWREPYLALVRSVISSGVAVYPNARLAGNPTVDPAELSSEDLYNDIVRHRKEIEAGDPPEEQSSWKDKLYVFVKYWRDSDFNGKWWNIDYTLTAFPGESEIFTLGVKNSESRYSPVSTSDSVVNYTMQGFLTERGRDLMVERPVDPVFFCYDDSWYPDFYRNRYEAYDSDHFNYWYGGEVLRKNVKSQYRYEGPAAYVEGSVRVGQAVRHRPRTTFRNRQGFMYKRGDAERERVIGSERSFAAGGDDSRSTSYRPGVIAKALGTLASDMPPVAVPVILPVFDRISLMPTYMPIPYGFGVLRPGNSLLDRFLAWLAGQEDLYAGNTMPPDGSSNYLAALQHLTRGKEFRYYGWNPDFDAAVFNGEWKELLQKWHSDRTAHVYSRKNPAGPGWLQEPRLCYAASSSRGQEKDRIESVADRIHGGTATRYFIGSDRYYVVDGRGQIVTNDDLDPTISYNNSFGSGGGGGSWHSGSPDSRRGPARL